MNSDNSSNLHPPLWADEFLRAFVGPNDADPVSGDLLEEYRDTVHPSRGPGRADLWFIRQVSRIVWRGTWKWALAFAVLQLGRDMLDWYVPPADYALRSALTTYFTGGLFAALGCLRGWRTRSLRSTSLTAALSALIAAAVKNAGIFLLVLIIWPGTQTQYSGGLEEAVLLPWLIVLPGLVIAVMCGWVGKTAAKHFHSTSAP